ncbi:hypothetical protein BDB01DRAFT_797649 [Pilobolus umbonatus]|nr:hypothetical protein BDB01DRAFT_797649 [Pilobolus umbonatus]
MSQDSIKEQRKRDKFFSFAQSTAYGLTKEINRYYSQTNSNTRSIPGSPQSNTPPSLSRANTDEIDEIISTSIPEITHPQCIIFPTYGCKIIEEKEVKWKVVLAGWTFAKPGSSRLDRWLLAAGRTYGGLSRNSVEDNHFSSLLNQFRCQTMRMASIQLTLPGVIAEKIIQNNETHAHHELNAEQKEKIRDYAASVTSNYNGRFEEEVVLDHHAIEELRSQSKYLSVQANFDDNDTTFDGSIDLIGEYGVSVISDIDDTIKVTDILDGKDAILQNTFFKPGREVPQMNGVYQAWAAEGAHVHYVSNSPWQVYPALSEFIIKKGFPRGSMHLRNVSTQELIIGKPGKHKIETVSNILCDFPNRKFILVGDSGEIDPEM